MHTLLYATQEYEVLVSEAKIKNTLIVICILLQCIHYYQGAFTTKPNGSSLKTCSGLLISLATQPLSAKYLSWYSLLDVSMCIAHLL